MALIFDFDSTLVADESLVSLLVHSLESDCNSDEEVRRKKNDIEKITNDGIAGKIDMITSYQQRLAIAKPTLGSVQSYLDKAEQMITNGMRETISKFHKEFPHVVLHVVSQGPHCIVAPICKRYFPQFSDDCIHAVRLDISKGQETGEYISKNEIILKQGKSNIVKSIIENSGNAKQCYPVVIVGDGVSDMKVRFDGIAHVGIGFGLHKKFEAARKMSDYYITESDLLQELYPLLASIFSEKKLIKSERTREDTHNFFSGPAIVPTQVLQRVSNELLNFQYGLGMSIMELSHRDNVFVQILEQAKTNLRKIYDIPDNFHILFMQGGSSMQFSAIPMNLMGSNSCRCNYIVTGQWSEKGAKEAKQYCDNVKTINAVSHSGTDHMQSIIDSSEWNLDDGKSASYTYICDNETVHGIEFPEAPQLDESKVGPLVADMSSNFLSRPIDFSRFALVYACAQKNFGVAGLVTLIIRKDLVGKSRKGTPFMLDFKVIADTNSLENTPPTFGIYMANLIFEWTLHQGGMQTLNKMAIEKSSILYDFIDSSKIYKNYISKKYRSRMNIVFRICIPGLSLKENEQMEKKFVQEATEQGFIGLNGHRSVGGLRASLYNALSKESVTKLIHFMREFEKKTLCTA